MKNNQKITWKYVPILVIAPDGETLKGEIKYWDKDYTVFMEVPFFAKSEGKHLLYNIPVRYVIDEEPREGIRDIHLLEKAQKILLSLYKKGDKK